jgi:uncharacterized protein
MKQRIVLVDALMGFALLLIALIHFVEHFDFFLDPEFHFLFPVKVNELIHWQTIKMISGRAYSIFALLFGFSFFIQLDRREQKGGDFRLRFLWRLTILLIIGFLHSLLYKGDILTIYAVLGFILVLFYKVNTRILLIMILILGLQLPLIYELIQSFTVADFKLVEDFGSSYGAEAVKVYRNGTLFDVFAFNLWEGRAAILGWNYYNGRLYQLFALFLVGLIIGRLRIFENLEKYVKSFVAFLVACFVLYVGVILAEESVNGAGYNELQNELFSRVLSSYESLLVTMMTCVSIILIYMRFPKNAIFSALANYGKMSLTNYVSQSIIGTFIFYGFGLGAYRYLGASWSLLLGFSVFCLQALFSSYWTKQYYYGPLEWLWKALTYMDFGIKFKRE